MTEELEPLITYAQNREDIILFAFFSFLNKPGFYVDVGAYHPEEDSVTKFFYDRGWHGVNIEPDESMFKLFEKERPEDINLNIGISNKKGTLKFREYENKGLSTFSESMKETYETSHRRRTGNYTDLEIETTTLKAVFSSHKVDKIQFLKVDAEGMEYEILEGNDWKKYRPQVLCIESNHVFKNWRPLLKKNGYNKVFFDGLNEYYVANECPEIAKNFSYVGTLLEGPQVVSVHTYRKEAQLKEHEAGLKRSRSELQKRAQDYEKEIARQQFKISELETTAQHLHAELDSRQGLKRQIKSVYRGVDDKIIRSIHRRGHARNTNKASVKFPVIQLSEHSKKDLMRIARSYDGSSYFRYYPGREDMKLRYRLAGKLYRTTRNVAEKSAGKSYQLTKRRGK